MSGASEVGALPTITIDFSEAIFPPTLDPAEVIFRAVGGRAIRRAAAFDAAADRLTISPRERLRAGARYEVVVPEFVEDLVANTLPADAAARTVSFTVDATRPRIESSIPSDGGALLATDVVTLTFSEAPDEGTLSPASLRVQTTAGAPVLVGLSTDAPSRTVVLVPAANWLPGSYTIVVDRAALRDLAGNAMAENGEQRINFSVAP